MENYLKGVSAIRGAGCGGLLVETWIEEAPMVAKEVGEDVVADLATASWMLASKTLGAVIDCCSTPPPPPPTGWALRCASAHRTNYEEQIRHAGHHLQQQRSAKKLLIVITDGETADIDVRVPQYLRMDTKKAVEEVAKIGVTTYCMSLDPRADNYVSCIFGQKNSIVVDHVRRLPEKLLLLYAGLTR